MARDNSHNHDFRNSFPDRDVQGQNVQYMMAGLKDHTAAYRRPIPTLSSVQNPGFQNTWNPPSGYQNPYYPNPQFAYNTVAPQQMPPQTAPYGHNWGHSFGMPGQPYGAPNYQYPPHAVYSQQPPFFEHRGPPPANYNHPGQQQMRLRSCSERMQSQTQTLPEPARSYSTPADGEGNGLKARAQVFSAGGMSFFPSAARPGDPINRAVVLLQGVYDAEEQLLRKCLHRMGFDEPNIVIVHEKQGIIPELEAKRNIATIISGLTPGSNLLLILCAYTYEGIELKPDFLTNDIYKVVAQFNNKMRERNKSATRMPNQQTSDNRRYEGITLHVVLDNVKGSVLPYALKFEAETRPRSYGLKSTWKVVPRPEKDGREFHEKMNFGRIAQFCSDATRCGHKPGALLSAFLCVNLEEAYLPYNVLTYKILDLLNHQFDNCAPRVVSSQDRNAGARAMGEELVLLPLQAMLVLYIEYRKNLTQKRAKEARDSMIAKGEVLLSSASQFDPNLSVDFCWRDETIPLSVELSGLDQCVQ